MEECSTTVHCVGAITAVRSDHSQDITAGDQPATGVEGEEEKGEEGEVSRGFIPLYQLPFFFMLHN